MYPDQFEVWLFQRMQVHGRLGREAMEFDVVSYVFPRTGSWENLQETPIYCYCCPPPQKKTFKTTRGFL